MSRSCDFNSGRVDSLVHAIDQVLASIMMAAPWRAVKNAICGCSSAACTVPYSASRKKGEYTLCMYTKQAGKAAL